MNLQNLFDTDDRAVSPVIGVILMVAITVILAAVIGTFVLGLGDSLGDSQPSAQLELSEGEPDGGALAIDFEHTGGDTIRLSEFEIQVASEGDWDTSESTSADLDTASGSDTLSVGESATVDIDTDSGDGDPTIDNVKIIHKPSQTIFIDQTLILDDGSGFDGFTNSE